MIGIFHPEEVFHRVVSPIIHILGLFNEKISLFTMTQRNYIYPLCWHNEIGKKCQIFANPVTRAREFAVQRWMKRSGRNKARLHVKWQRCGCCIFRSACKYVYPPPSSLPSSVLKGLVARLLRDLSGQICISIFWKNDLCATRNSARGRRLVRDVPARVSRGLQFIITLLKLLSRCITQNSSKTCNLNLYE